MRWFPRWFQLADFKTFSLVNKINKCIVIFTENVYFRIWLWNGNNKRGTTLHRLDCFDTRSIINTLAIDYWLELKHLILFHSSIPYVSSTLFDNPTQCLIDFENQMIYSILFCELGFVEWLSCIKLFHLKEFDLVWKPNIQKLCDMLDIHVQCTCVSLNKYFSSERQTDRENKSIIDKNIMPLCFSHIFY